jgi:peptidoglycan/xylan/chitin deacetylase (PgdA/CDA1 family)
MHSLFASFSFLFLCGSALQAQQPAPLPHEEGPKALPLPATSAKDEDDGVRVTVLGYHDFSKTLKETEMRINTDKFRKQMSTLKEQGLTVISMADFAAWKRGEKSIPVRSVLITLDDGWNSIYTDAYPILKEFGYPFTIFLYTKYVDVQGRSLTLPMVREMQKNGASIGSHSVSHHYPSTVKSQQRKGPKNYTEYLNREMGQSKEFLEKNFNQKVTAYCYPGGFHTDEMFVAGKKLGYEKMFTVLPGKIKRSSDNNTLPRYIILGTYDKIFTLATEFRDSSAALADSINAPKQTTAYPVKPEPGSVVNTRLPTISADLSTLTDMKPETLIMRVAGFGDVPAVFDPQTKLLSWKVNRRLRTDICQVSVTWKTIENKTISTPLLWNFIIDKEAAYQPNGG